VIANIQPNFTKMSKKPHKNASFQKFLSFFCFGILGQKCLATCNRQVLMGQNQIIKPGFPFF
jgi:hypothetical protein